MSTTRSPGRRAAASRSPSRRVAARSASGTSSGPHELAGRQLREAERRPVRRRGRPRRAGRGRRPARRARARASSGVATVRDQLTAPPGRRARGRRAAGGAARPAGRAAGPRSGGRSAARAGDAGEVDPGQVDVVQPAAQRRQRARTEEPAGGRQPERHHDRGRRQLELARRPAAAGRALGARRRAVARRPALQRVEHADLGAVAADLGEQRVEQLAAAADERLAALVLLRAGRLAEHEQPGAGRERARDDVRAGGRQLGAGGAAARPLGQGVEVGAGERGSADDLRRLGDGGGQLGGGSLTRRPGARGRGRAAASSSSLTCSGCSRATMCPASSTTTSRARGSAARERPAVVGRRQQVADRRRRRAPRRRPGRAAPPACRGS